MHEVNRVVAGLFGRVAATYDQAGFLQQIAQRLVAHAGVRSGMRVLDVACGTGAALLEATRRAGPDGLAVGVDLAEPMAAQAARRLQALGPAAAPAAVAVMDAERPGLRPASFDVVLVASAVYLLGEPAAALRGLWALLRPGGRLAVSDFADLDPRWAWKDELLRRLAPPLEPLGGGRLRAGGLERLLRSTGAGQVTIAVEQLDVAYADAPAWWAEQWTHGERWALEHMDDWAVEAYQAAAFAAIEACREADGAIHWRPSVVYAVADG
ncbi:MAG TPA: methyltransferase domain-containing protein [Actinomycetes bacterium]